jgi:hypothetical protein
MRTLRPTLAILLVISSTITVAQDSFRAMELEVLDASGKPLSEATIDVSSAEMEFPLTVSKEGLATLNLPSDAAQLTLKASCPDHIPLEVRWSQANIPQSFTFKMSRGEPIGGIVQDEQGRPIEGVEVEGLLVSYRAAGEGEIVPEVGGLLGTTDGQGRWRAEVATAEPLELRLKLTHQKYFSDRSFGKRRISNDQLRSLEHIEVLDDRISPQGTITRADGKPAADVLLFVLDGVEPFVLENGQPADKSRQPTTTSGQDGKYEFAEPEGTFATLCLADAGWAIVPGKRYEKNKPVDVTLTAWASLHGVLTEGNKPVAGENLQLLVHDSDSLGGGNYTEWNNYATTNDKGEFQFSRLTDGFAILGQRVEYCGATEHKRQDFSNEFQLALAAGADMELPCTRNGTEVTGTVVPLRYDGSESTITCGMIVLTKEDEPTDMVQNFFFEWGKAATVGMEFDPVESAAWVGSRPKPSYVGSVEADGSFRIDHVPPGSYRAQVTLRCEGEPDAEFEEDRKGGWHEGSIWEAFSVKPEGEKRAVKLGLLEVEVYSTEE